jgi:hypothetical protein
VSSLQSSRMKDRLILVWFNEFLCGGHVSYIFQESYSRNDLVFKSLATSWRVVVNDASVMLQVKGNIFNILSYGFVETVSRNYAAMDSLLAIALAMSFFLAPAAKRARTSRSSETAGSLASILATRDWLERRRFARSLCERPWRCRRSFKLALKVSLSSTKAASSGVRPRKSFADPTFHPAALRRFRLARRN